tara:strand:- start:1349 stop:1645 length:297 start_codon:yes stop_codon:yes gene_type:complete
MVGTNRLKSEILSYQVIGESVLGVIYEGRFSAKTVIITKINQITMERQNYYNVRYLGKLIKVIPAYSKWQAIDKLYSEKIQANPMMDRKLLTAVKTKN